MVVETVDFSAVKVLSKVAVDSVSVEVMTDVSIASVDDVCGTNSSSDCLVVTKLDDIIVESTDLPKSKELV